MRSESSQMTSSASYRVSPVARQLMLACAMALGTAVFYHDLAQAADGSSGLEELFSDADDPAAPAQPRAPAEPKANDSGTKTGANTDAKTGANGPVVKRLSDLAGLSPFTDIAVIQKRFLPKTGRFELFGGASSVLNDPFFINLGLNLRLAYYFREKWGVEFVGMGLTTIDRQITQGLRDRSITTTSLVTPAFYAGVDAKWSPIYGKMTLLNKNIVPFDMYFSVGLGGTGTNQGILAPTLHVGTGQVFALSKSWALRWDASVNIYSTTSNAGPGRSNALYNNVFATVGASWFFPEATYR